VNFTGKE